MGQKKTWRWLLPALLVFAAGFVLAAFYDLAINVAVYNPKSVFAVIMEAVGWYPSYLPTLMLLMLWMLPEKKTPLLIARSVASAVILLLGAAALFFNSYRYFTKRGLLVGGASLTTWVLLALAVLVFAVGFVLLCRAPGIMREKLNFFCLWATIYLVAQQVVINLVKLLWQRTRFDDMLAGGSLEQFTHWFAPGGQGGSSFPSGHTAGAAGILVLVLLCDIFASWAGRRNLVYVLCWAYIGLMALARIIIGRHYLSDTLAAAGIMALLLFGLRRLPPYKRGAAEMARLTEGDTDGI